MQTLERARWAGSKHGCCRWLAGVLGEQKVGWLSTAKGRGMTPESRGTRPPGGNDLVELGLGRSIGHERVPRRRRGETRCRAALDVHYGMDGTGQQTIRQRRRRWVRCPLVVVMLLRWVWTWSRLKSVPTAFGRFNACPECLGTHARTRTRTYAQWRWARRADGTGDGDWGRWGARGREGARSWPG